MSETPTPSKGQTKRRGLALPPRGQALARLQDLEQDSGQDSEEENQRNIPLAKQMKEESSATEISNAVNTASSNAVNHPGSTALIETQETAQVARNKTSAPKPSVRAPVIQKPAPVAATPVAAGIGHQLQARAVREPTTRITVDMPDSLHRKISMLAAETRHSIKDLVLDALAATYFAADQDSS